MTEKFIECRELAVMLYIVLWSVLSEDFNELIKYVNYTTES